MITYLSSKYIIKTSTVPVRCFICDVTIKPGESFVLREDEKMCLTCGLPARRLRPGISAARAAIK